MTILGVRPFFWVFSVLGDATRMKYFTKTSTRPAGVKPCRHIVIRFLFCVSIFGCGDLPVAHAQETASLRAELEKQKEELARQMQELQDAQRKIEELEARILEIEASGTIERSASKESPRPESATRDLPASPVSAVIPAQRDRVGDLNAEMIRAGEFPGSLELPGTEKISLAIGGFVKTVAIADSDAEAAGAAFLPAFLQTGVKMYAATSASTLHGVVSSSTRGLQ